MSPKTKLEGPDEELVPQKRGMKAERTPFHSTVKYPRNQVKKQSENEVLAWGDMELRGL